MPITVDLADGFQENDQGTRLEFTVVDQAGAPVDISNATLTDALKLRIHAGQAKLRTPTFVSDGADGKMQYITVAGDLVPFGDWELQGQIIDIDGEWHSLLKGFEVRCNL